MSNCKAKNPATCRTHGEPIREDITRIKSVFANAHPNHLTKKQALSEATKANKYSKESIEITRETLDDLYKQRGDAVAVQNFYIAEALESRLTSIRSELNKGKVDFSTYPGDSLAAELRTAASSRGHFEREIWLRENGVHSSSDDDTVFKTKYVYCSQHLRPHTAGWCTVSVINKAPMKAETHEEAYAEARSRGFKIFGENKPEPASEQPQFKLHEVDTGRAIENHAWLKTLPEEDKKQLDSLIRKAKKKDVLKLIDDQRKAYENSKK